MKNHNLAKSIQELSLFRFKEILKYKAEWYDRKVVEIDKWFPSSKLCSCCGYKYQNLKLSEREWTCPSCNTKHDRDYNSSKNIEKEGERIYNNKISECITEFKLVDYPTIDDCTDMYLKSSDSMKQEKSNIRFIQFHSYVDDHQVYEMSRINKNEIPYDINVFNGTDGGFRNEQGEPHFHVSDNIKNPTWKLSILIPSIKEWKLNNDLIIIPNHSSQPDWLNLKKVKKDLMYWLIQKNLRYKQYSNLYVVINTWNANNVDNTNVRQVLQDDEDI